MKTLALAFAMTAMAVAQSNPGLLAGMWTAQFQGTTFVRLELKATNGRIAGALSLGNFEVDEQGMVRRAANAPESLTPIDNLVQRGTILTFSRTDSTEPDRFEFRHLERGRAELRLLLSDADREELAASGIPAPRPIALAK
jgi:hypothetical protein